MIALIWLLWLLAAAEFALGVHSYVVERREGMRISLVRMTTVTAVFAIATLLAVSASLTWRGPERAVSPTPRIERPIDAGKNEQVHKTQAELERNSSAIDRLTREHAQVSERLQKLRDAEFKLRREMNALRDENSVFSTLKLRLEQMPDETRMIAAMTLVVIAVMIGFATLLFGGEIQTLLPVAWAQSRRDPESKARKEALDQVALLVSEGRYRDALAKADDISENKLGQFDLLDLYFLRGYAAVQIYAFPAPDDTSDYRDDLIQTATEQLQAAVERAPKRGEAVYTLAVAYGLAGKDSEALKLFEQARKVVKGEELPFEHNESVCLLRLAEVSLSSGDTEKAEAYFAQVASLDKLGSSVVQARVRIGMMDLRNAMSKQAIAPAEALMQKITAMPGLTPEQRGQIEVIAWALNARLALIEDDPERALAELEKFVSRHMPTGLPPLDDELVDEAFSPLLDADLAFPREIYHGFLFLQAVARCRSETKGRSKLTEAQVTRLAEPLLQALQINPRHRDLLGVIGGLYYWMRRDKRAKAREWLEAAVTMGVRSSIVRLILERDRIVGVQRSEALDLFRSASARFLRDPTIASELRRALVEELGRFQEFEPMLISLQEKPELEPQELTIDLLRERARYLSELVASVACRGDTERHARLSKLHAEYSASLESLEQSAQSLEMLQRRVMSELGDILVLT